MSGFPQKFPEFWDFPQHVRNFWIFPKIFRNSGFSFNFRSSGFFRKCPEFRKSFPKKSSKVWRQARAFKRKHKQKHDTGRFKKQGWHGQGRRRRAGVKSSFLTTFCTRLPPKFRFFFRGKFPENRTFTEKS